MNNLLIRNVNDDVLLRLSEMAKKKGVSRNAFIREQLELLAEYPDIMEHDSKYEELFNRVMDVQEKTLQMLASNINLMNESRQTLRETQKRLTQSEEDNGE
jgi:stress response protein YsnF